MQGVDLWLNNPRRGQEACGTSGMKAAMNGVLNLSILDGWFDEAYDYSGGWAIGDREEYNEEQDEIHASDIYSKLEKEIVPLYFESREQGVPVDWVQRMKQSIAAVTPRFSSGRMVAEYVSELYDPAHKLWQNISRNNFKEARRKSDWDAKLSAVWNQVRFIDFGEAPGDRVMSGSPVPLRATVDLAGLQPEDVRVEAVIGRIGVNGHLQDFQTVGLVPVEQTGEAYVFSNQYVVQQTGRIGYSVRVSPNHFENALTRPCNAPLKWGSD